MSQAGQQKLNRLQEIVEIYPRWDRSMEQVKRMRAWVLAAAKFSPEILALSLYRKSSAI